MAHPQKKVIETVPEEEQVKIASQRLKINCLKYVQRAKKTINKDIQATSRKMYKQIENINKEKEMIKETQTEVLWLKCLITEMKKSLEGFNSTFEHTVETISDLKMVI